MSNFAGHGKIACHIQGQTLIIEGIGPWNLEALIEAKKQSQHLFDQLNGSIWGKVMLLEGDPIYVPNAAEHLVELIELDKENGCVATALVVSQSNSPEFAKRHISEIHSKANDDFRFFANQSDAHWWLVQKITAAQIR